MYTVRPVLKMMLLAVPAFLGLLFFIRMLAGRQPLDIRGGVRRSVKALPFILAASVLGGLLCLAYMRAGAPYTGSFKMIYTYPQASKGLTPSGTTLDVSEIFSEEVLQKTLESGYFGDLTTEELQNTLRINNVKQRGRISADDLYVSTEYRISYLASDQTASVDKNLLIKELSDTYYELFKEKYGRKTDVLQDDYAEVDELDYLDVSRYLNSRIEAVIGYMEMCSKENSTFVSEATKESFSSIKDKAKNFKDVSLERYRAYVLKYGISKDKEQYISRLNYENHMKNVDYMKNLASYRVRLDAIERYDGEITRAVLVPTVDEDGKFYQSRTKIGTDYFAKGANNHLEYATDLQLRIETNNYYIQSLSAALGDMGNRQKASEMVEGLKEEIMSISRLAKETVEDYDIQTSNGYISFILPEENTGIRPYLKKTVLYAAVVFGALFVTVFWGPVVSPGKKKQERLKLV